MKTRTALMGINFDNLNYDQALLSIEKLINTNETKTIFFINADCVYKALNNRKYFELLQNCDLLLPDGIGLRLACNIHGLRKIENCNGTDFSPKLMQLAADNELSVFLLGGKNRTSLRAAKTFQKMIPGLKIAGTSSGFHDNWDAVIDEIKSSGAKILFVGMGVPFQEFWISKYKEKFSNLIILGVGGLFDYFSGNVLRAPRIIRQLKMEWLWRVIQEPKRLFARYFIDGFKFMKIVFFSSSNHLKK